MEPLPPAQSCLCVLARRSLPLHRAGVDLAAIGECRTTRFRLSMHSDIRIALLCIPEVISNSEKSSDFKPSQGDDMSKSTKLLIVEDDAGLRHVHDIFFNFKGFDLTIVPEGREVLQKVQTQSYDVVILDLGLPDIEGLDLLAQIRKVSAVPVIVMTARTDRQSINRSLELGANDYINKPFRPEILLKRIEAVLADPGSRMKQNLIGSI